MHPSFWDCEIANIDFAMLFVIWHVALVISKIVQILQSIFRVFHSICVHFKNCETQDWLSNASIYGFVFLSDDAPHWFVWNSLEEFSIFYLFFIFYKN